MGWESKVAYQMLSCFCLFWTTLSWMAPFALLLLLFSIYQLVRFGFLSLLFTSLALLLSTILYLWNHKSVPVEEENVNLTSEGKKCSHERENIATTPMLMNEPMIEFEAKERQEEQEVSDGVANEDSSDLDGSISDEDSLIEITLPSGHFVDQQQECKYNNCSLQQNKMELLSAESLSNQQSLMEFLAEFNETYEEENLIEIDISMGSIKCSRFEIEA